MNRCRSSMGLNSLQGIRGSQIPDCVNHVSGILCKLSLDYHTRSIAGHVVFGTLRIQRKQSGIGSIEGQRYDVIGNARTSPEHAGIKMHPTNEQIESPQVVGGEDAIMMEFLSNSVVEFLVDVFLPVATLALLFIGIRIAHRTLARSVTPQVECFLRPRRGSQVIELAIANHGLGSAYNVDITLEVDEDDFEAHNVLLQWRKTVAPFNIIEPGGRISTIFGIAHKLLGDEPYLKQFTALVEYQWQPFWSKRPKKENRTYRLDIRAFSGLTYEPEKNEIAEVLKEELPKISERKAQSDVTNS